MVIFKLKLKGRNYYRESGKKSRHRKSKKKGSSTSKEGELQSNLKKGTIVLKVMKITSKGKTLSFKVNRAKDSGNCLRNYGSGNLRLN